MMFIRASGGADRLSYSSDRGDTWSVPANFGDQVARLPATIKRLPSTGDLLLVWNDHAGLPAGCGGRRVPLSTTAISTTARRGSASRCWKAIQGPLLLHRDPPRERRRAARLLRDGRPRALARHAV